MSDMKKYIEKSKKNLNQQIAQFEHQMLQAQANMHKAQGALEVTLQMEAELNKEETTEETPLLEEVPKEG